VEATKSGQVGILGGSGLSSERGMKTCKVRPALVRDRRSASQRQPGRAALVGLSGDGVRRPKAEAPTQALPLTTAARRPLCTSAGPSPATRGHREGRMARGTVPGAHQVSRGTMTLPHRQAQGITAHTPGGLARGFCGSRSAHPGPWGGWWRRGGR